MVKLYSWTGANVSKFSAIHVIINRIDGLFEGGFIVFYTKIIFFFLGPALLFPLKPISGMVLPGLRVIVVAGRPCLSLTKRQFCASQAVAARIGERAQ